MMIFLGNQDEILMRSLWIKRAIDLIGACLGIFIVVPLLFIISIVSIIDFKGRIFFQQIRVGYKRKFFYLIKFRTMKERYSTKGFLLPDKLRLTDIGRILRKTSLDEVPQFWNVIKGQMSLVGPRPHLEIHLDLNSVDQIRRHDMKPGITGWAQVKGRNSISWEKRFKYDVWYLNNWNIFLDLKILFLTISQVIKARGVYRPASIPAAEYKGENIILQQIDSHLLQK